MKVLVLMGVSGSGKTTVGRLLAEETGGRFYDGDDFHPPENVRRMKAGLPLRDQDRQEWLAALAGIVREARGLTIVACSALKEKYREVLAGAEFVFLDGPPALLAERMTGRKGHFMPPELLTSQLETLEPPESALKLDIRREPQELVCQIRDHFDL